MRRRAFIMLVGGAAVAVPLRIQAQQFERIRKIGVLTGYAETDPLIWALMMPFRQELHGLGWEEGRNIGITYRHAGTNNEQLRVAAQELIAARPELIVVQGNPPLSALRHVDQSIPTVFVQVGDPVGSGFVDSLSRPGGNLTGFTTMEPEMGGKWLELLKETAPRVTRALGLLHPDITANLAYLRAIQAAGGTLNVAVEAAGVHNAFEIERAVTAFAREPNGSLIALPNPVTGSHRDLIVKLALAHRLPLIAAFRAYAASGFLMTYGPELSDLYRRAASYVDRILRGDQIANLPVQVPTKFEMVINLNTAKAIGLVVDPMLLARADEVIE